MASCMDCWVDGLVDVGWMDWWMGGHVGMWPWWHLSVLRQDVGAQVHELKRKWMKTLKTLNKCNNIPNTRKCTQTNIVILRSF